ncbi:unnamed protein product [Somion occarium]|uniref:Uncharacterized protein n=1 Tax=Somion occarium TaxID=3059160 RepID=A0ABP1DK01_9APHY
MLNPHAPCGRISDLRTHICFYKASSRFAALYGDEDQEEAFWESSCILSGLGYIEDEDLNATPWKEVAFDCIEKDGFCAHPQCGGARLEWNARQIAATMDLPGKPSSPDVQKRILGLEPNHRPNLTSNPVIKGLTFTHKPRGDLDDDDAFKNEAYLDHSQEEGVDSKVHHPPELEWHRHPIARRSFAVFPLVTRLCITNYPDFESTTCSIVSHCGLTMDDIVRDMHNSMDRLMSLTEIQSLLGTVSDLNEVFPDAVRFLSVLDRLNTMRGILYFFIPKCLRFGGWHGWIEGPEFEFEYQPARTYDRDVGAYGPW